MQTFLGRLVGLIIEKHQSDLGEVTLVLPSRRAKVYVIKHFKEQLKQSNWLPQIFSLEDFVQQLGQHKLLDQIDLNFELYEVHKQIEGKGCETLEEFMGWGGVLLQDFNEIDRYMVDSDELYTFLSEARAIEQWNLNNEELSDFQKKYLSFWRKLGQYYHAFRQKLQKEGTAYQGMAFRDVAERFLSGEIDMSKYPLIYFAGFNALTSAEQAIIEGCKKETQTETVWDADVYYLNDTIQESGRFLREERNKNPDFKWEIDLLNNDPKQINIYAVSGDVGQAKLTGDILNNYRGNTFENTAIVLCDEKLLMPTLEAIPRKVEQINVTMGYPISQTIFYQFFEAYLKLFYHREKFSTNQNGFYFKDVLHFLNQVPLQFLKNHLHRDLKIIQERIHKEQLIHVKTEHLIPISDKIGFSSFDLNTDSSKLIDKLLLWCNLFKNKERCNLDAIQSEFLFGFYKNFNRLKDLIAKSDSIISIESIWHIFRQLIEQESTAFVGEPLSGLQLMGVLETRTLDFERLILLSVNEGVLPAGKSQNSFIPYDIKRKFGLPSYREKDAIFAYHFYRLLQRAKQVELIYNTKVDQLKGGERSRFIEQLLYELPRKNPNVQIVQRTISPKLSPQAVEPISISKNEFILNKMKAHLKEGISASALNSYLQCPLNYYYQYTLGLREETEVEENIEDSTFGKIIHDSLEAIYKPYINLILDTPAIESMKSNIEKTLHKYYQKHLNLIPKSGNYRLSFEVAKRYINEVISLDQKEVNTGNEIQIIGLEEKFRWETELTLNTDERIDLCLKGIVDRLDRKNGKKRIIDYKTGKVESKDLAFKNLESLIRGRKDKAVQLLIYGLVYLSDNSEDLSAGILSMRNIKSGFIELKRDNLKEDAKNFLKSAIEQFLDSTEKLVHQEDSLYCSFCQ